VGVFERRSQRNGQRKIKAQGKVPAKRRGMDSIREEIGLYKSIVKLWISRLTKSTGGGLGKQ